MKFNLDDLSLTIKSQFGKKGSEVAKVMLKKKEQEIPQKNNFEMIVGSCHSKSKL